MTHFDRRTFLRTSLGGLASALAGGRLLADAPRDGAKPASASAPDTLFLTWQRDPTTTMTVQWVGEEGEAPDATIFHSPASKDDWLPTVCRTHPFPMTDRRVYRAELTGLTPGTDYQLRIGAAAPAYCFRTMPAKATSPIHFVSGGDAGVGPHVVNNNIEAARQDPMFAVIGGDIAYDNGKEPNTHLAFLRSYSKHMVGRGGRLIPMVVCIGNHEVRGGYGKPRSEAPFFYALHDGLFAERSFATLDFGDYLSLVLLDTGHTSPIEGEQTDWLRQTLVARADHPNVLVVNHVPAYPSHRKFQGENGKPGTGEGNRTHWVPLFERYRVDLVLEHHDHTFKRTHPLLDGHIDNRGLLYLGDGSWGKIRAPNKPEKVPYLAAASEAYHMTLHRIEDKQRFHMAIDETGRIMDVCMTKGKRPRRKVIG
jgi:3',5'-cyclic AMP phosphodiesterase CpdA